MSEKRDRHEDHSLPANKHKREVLEIPDIHVFGSTNTQHICHTPLIEMTFLQAILDVMAVKFQANNDCEYEYSIFRAAAPYFIPSVLISTSCHVVIF